MALVRLAVGLGSLEAGGGGLYPLDGGANTQGVCDMGTLPEFLPCYSSCADPSARRELGLVWGKKPP